VQGGQIVCFERAKKPGLASVLSPVSFLSSVHAGTPYLFVLMLEPAGPKVGVLEPSPTWEGKRKKKEKN